MVCKKFLNGIDSVDLPDISTATGKVNVSKDRKIIKSDGRYIIRDNEKADFTLKNSKCFPKMDTVYIDR